LRSMDKASTEANHQNQIATFNFAIFTQAI
jgi:hypothetical protein